MINIRKTKKPFKSSTDINNYNQFLSNLDNQQRNDLKNIEPTFKNGFCAGPFV